MNIISPESESRWPWAISIPGLTADGAQLVTQAITNQRPDVQVIQINPREFLSLHLDRATIEDLLEALGSTENSPGVDGFREVLEEWIEFAGPDDDE